MVDDDRVTLDVLSHLLTSEGFLVRGCESASEALGALREEPFDVLVTDLMMPEMSGFELIEEAEAIRPALRCMIMSGHHRTEEVAPEIAWIDKPFDVDRLVATLSA